jgi:hypothetical protein
MGIMMRDSQTDAFDVVLQSGETALKRGHAVRKLSIRSLSVFINVHGSHESDGKHGGKHPQLINAMHQNAKPEFPSRSPMAKVQIPPEEIGFLLARFNE